MKPLFLITIVIMVVLSTEVYGYINERVASCIYKKCSKERSECMVNRICSDSFDCLFECKKDDNQCQKNCYTLSDENYDFYKLTPCIMDCMLENDQCKIAKDLSQICDSDHDGKEICELFCHKELSSCAKDFVCTDAFQCALDCHEKDYKCYGLCICHANKNKNTINLLACYGACLNDQTQYVYQIEK